MLNQIRMEKLFKTKLAQLNNIIRIFEEVTLCTSMVVLATLLIVNVFARIFFQSIYFMEEITEFIMIFTAAVGLSYGVRKARHIRMGAIFDAMGHKTQKVLIFFILSITALTMFIMAYQAGLYVQKIFLREHFTAALRLPYWIFIVILPIGFFSAGIESILTIFKNIIEKDVWLSPEQQGEYE